MAAYQNSHPCSFFGEDVTRCVLVFNVFRKVV